MPPRTRKTPPPADQPPAPTPDKPKLTEYDRANAAYEKAKAKTDKSAEKVTEAEKKLEELRATAAADKRTSDYLFMHPALAERREQGGEVEQPAAPGRVFTEENGEALGVTPPVSEEITQPDGSVVLGAPVEQPPAPSPFDVDALGKDDQANPAGDADWDAAAPTAPTSDPFAGDPFGQPVDTSPAQPQNPFNPADPFGGQ